MSKYKQSVFTGVATAMVTPFNGGKIDYEAFSEMIGYQIGSGVNALVISGTTGEASTLIEEEFRSLIGFAVRLVGGKVPVIAGSGSNCTDKACRLTSAAFEEGADACLVVTPYYNKATQKGLVESYRAVAEIKKKPIIIYNVPSRTGVNISPDTYEKLSEIENIVAVKEADTDIVKTAELISRLSDTLDVYTGNDNELLPVLALGGMGVISVASNIVPMQMKNICESWFGGNITNARREFRHLLPLMKALFSEVNPIPVKTALALREMCKEEFRLPLCRMSEEGRANLEKILPDYYQPANG